MESRLKFLITNDLLIAGKAWAQQANSSGRTLHAAGNYYFRERSNTLRVNRGIPVAVKPFILFDKASIKTRLKPWVSNEIVGFIPTGNLKPHHMGGVTDIKKNGNRDGIQLAKTGAYSSASFGDPSLQAGYEHIDDGYTGPSFHINATLKIPLASLNRGFGTGTRDAGIGEAAGYPYGSLHLYPYLLYWCPGFINAPGNIQSVLDKMSVSD